MTNRAALEITVDHQHHVTLLQLQRKAEADVPVTTIAENQRRARIELTVYDGTRRERLSVVELTSLPQNLNRRARITIHARVTRGRAVELNVEVEGRILESRRISVSPWLPRRTGVWLVPALAVAVVVAVVGLALLRPSAGTGNASLREEDRPREEAQRDAVTPGEQMESADADGEPGGSGGESASSSDSSAEAAPEAAARADEQAADVSQKWTVYFRPNDPRLTTETQAALDALIPTLRRRINSDQTEAQSVSLRINGHCAIAGSEAGRLELSRQRAENVWAYLEDQGVPEAEELTVRGFGAWQTLTRDPDNQDANRRVEILLRCQGDC